MLCHFMVNAVGTCMMLSVFCMGGASDGCAFIDVWAGTVQVSPDESHPDVAYESRSVLQL